MKICEIYETANINALPVSPVEAAAAEGITAVAYSSISEIYCRELEELYAQSRFGFSFKKDGRYFIAVNDRLCSEKRRRFTIAHELGHCVLGHLDNGRSPCAADERAADVFAAELLAPLCVLNFCCVTSPLEISRMCGISRKAAEIRFAELQKKRVSDFDFLGSDDDIRIVTRFSRYITSRVSIRGQDIPFYGIYK